MRTYIIVGCVLAVALVAALFAQHYKTEAEEYQYELKMAIGQNVHLTKTAREEKADAFRDGLIVCSNEDVEWLNEQADYYNSLAGANPLSKLMREWAQTWAYDEKTVDEMVEAYMGEGTH